MPEVGPDRELLDVHAEAGVVADLRLLAPDQGEQVVAVDRSRRAGRPSAARIVGQQVDRLHQRLVPLPAVTAPPGIRTISGVWISSS